MSIEQRANIKFCFKLGKTFTETHQMIQQAYGSDCLSRAKIKNGFGVSKTAGNTSLTTNVRVGQEKP